MNNSSLIFFNTIIQYVRTGANVVLSLYATRLVLEALGTNQYGIYTLVGGIVSMLSFFTNALTSTTQRYLSYNSAKQNIDVLKSYFFNSVTIHASFGGILLILLLSVQPLLFSGFLNIQEADIGAAKWVFIAIAFMLFIAMLSSPFRAVLISRENIAYISLIDILDGVLKLIIGFGLFAFKSDRLIWYASLMCGISVFNLLALGIYAIIKFPESRVFDFKYINKTQIKELSFFAVWTIYGTICLFGRVQGVAIVINKFFGTIINASYGIALQINSALGAVSGALQTALAPQLIKSEGSSNREKMLIISETGCKMSFILLSLVGIPIIFNIDLVLQLWLGNHPEYCAFFSIILIVSNLVDQLTVGFNSSMNAIGNIKNYNLVVNTLKLTTTLFLALALYNGVNLYYAFSIYLFIEIIGTILRLYFCHKEVGLNIYGYIKNVVLRLLVPTLVLCLSFYMLTPYIGSIISRMILCIGEIVVYLLLIYLCALNTLEKQIFRTLIRRK